MTAPDPTLPRLLVLTDRTQCNRPLMEIVTEAVSAGARAVVVRDKDLPHSERVRLAERIRELLDPLGGLVLVAGPWGDAVHLASDDAMPSTRPSLVGRSCHDAAEVAQAASEACDYVTVSPVFASGSKPGYGPPLGIARLRSLVRQGPPAFALGGVQPQHVGDCLAAGAHGVAVMGPVMHDPSVVQTYLAELSAAPA